MSLCVFIPCKSSTPSLTASVLVPYTGSSGERRFPWSVMMALCWNGAPSWPIWSRPPSVIRMFSACSSMSASSNNNVPPEHKEAASYYPNPNTGGVLCSGIEELHCMRGFLINLPVTPIWLRKFRKFSLYPKNQQLLEICYKLCTWNNV